MFDSILTLCCYVFFVDFERIGKHKVEIKISIGQISVETNRVDKKISQFKLLVYRN